MFHRSIFLYMAWILRRTVLLWWRAMLHATSLAGILRNGLQASVLVLMIHRAVCYFLTRDSLISEGKIKGCIGATCPCFLFGKNAQFLGSGTLAGSCTTHCMLWGLLTSLCCVFTGGLVLAVPGSAVACYACGYRQALRTKYNLPEAPCGDLTTHLFCHLCAICQEYREIRERTDSVSSSAHNVTPPPTQTMDEP
ncbi:hypothetical protein ABZP36_027029 [Zizania latifolia]